MKTILIAHNYTENSFAYMSYYLAHNLACKGNRVVFISHDPFFSNPFKENIEKGELLVYSWPTKNRPTKLSDAIWFAKIYLKYKPSIIISHFVGVNITTVVSKLLSLGKVKTYPYYHTLSTQILQDATSASWKISLKKIRKKILYKLFSDNIICPSELAKKDLENYYGIDKGFVVLNPMRDRFEIKKELSNDSIVISYLGRLASSKGVIELIEAFEIYKSKYSKSKIILNIAGSGSQLKEVEELVNKNTDIFYRGVLSYDKIDAYLNESHFAIIPSKFDNLPTVGLESMMNQTPLLISNTTGLTYYLTDEKECFKFNPNVDSMVEMFSRVEENFGLQEQMGKNARATFLEKFSMKNYCDIFSEIM